MSRFSLPKDWVWTMTDSEFVENLASQQTAQTQAPPESAQQSGVGALSGNLGSFGSITVDNTGGASAYSYVNWSTSTPAENFLSSIGDLDPICIKEIIVQESMYMQAIALLKLTGLESLKSFEYATAYGILLVKNEKYQFNLDKYIEDGPSEEK
jgi:hypothetical protein